MPKLIERGHTHIPHPPLFKIKKGKTERYIKNEAALNHYLITAAVEEAHLYVDSEERFVTGDALKPVLKKLITFEGIMKRLERQRVATPVVRALALEKGLAKADLKDQKRLQRIMDRVGKFFSVHYPEITLHLEMGQDEEHKAYQ